MTKRLKIYVKRKPLSQKQEHTHSHALSGNAAFNACTCTYVLDVGDSRREWTQTYSWWGVAIAIKM